MKKNTKAIIGNTYSVVFNDYPFIGVQYKQMVLEIQRIPRGL